MKPPEDIKKYFKNATLSTNQEKHEAIFENILNTQQQANEQEPGYSRISLGRFIMKSPVSKIAIAAIVFIACIIGVTLFDSTSNVILANVLTQIEKFDAYKFRIDLTSTGQTAEGRKIDEYLQHTMLISQKYGFKINREKLDPNNIGNISQQETYILPHKKIAIIIGHSQKMYQQTDIDATYLEQIKKQYDPYIMIEEILNCQYKNLGRSTIDGIEVEGFQTTDPNYKSGIYSLAQVDIKLWVNVKTQLPVRMEMNFLQKDMDINVIMYDFLWNAPVDATDFEPNIPEDYTAIQTTPIPAINEDNAIKGLKLFVDLIGKYPKNMNLETLQSQMDSLKNAQEQLEYPNSNSEKQEQYNNIKNTNISKTIQGLAAFFIVLNLDKKDPAYYGDRVLPGDADNVLMRWKVSDNDYRVIFGDLKVETLTYETLVQIEKTLPEKNESEN